MQKEWESCVGFIPQWISMWATFSLAPCDDSQIQISRAGHDQENYFCNFVCPFLFPVILEFWSHCVLSTIIASHCFVVLLTYSQDKSRESSICQKCPPLWKNAHAPWEERYRSTLKLQGYSDSIDEVSDIHLLVMVSLSPPERQALRDF